MIDNKCISGIINRNKRLHDVGFTDKEKEAITDMIPEAIRINNLLKIRINK